MLPSWITDPLWDQFHALLPERIDQQRRRARRLLRPTGPLFWSLLLYRLAQDHAPTAAEPQAG